MWWITVQLPPKSGYSLRSVFSECGSLVTMRPNSQPDSVSMFCSASDSNRPSSPTRRTSLPALRSPS